MTRPIHAQIDLSALAYNLHLARRTTRAKVMAVIKANAYGHGLLRVADALRAADGFALLDVRDAVSLREAGFTQPILLLEGFFSAQELSLVAEYQLSCVIHSAWQLSLLDQCSQRGAVSVWLKINTGMNRLGFAPNDVGAVLETLQRHRAVSEVTLMTHFSQADEVQGVSVQHARFKELAGARRLPCSLSNSAALLRYPETHADWVRPGIMLYGASPFADSTAAQLGLRPVMSLTSRIIAIQNLRAGDAVGYGAQFRADRAMRIGIVACGYADGYPRHAATGTPILVGGKLTRTLGRVSMDMLCVDLTSILDANVGERVTMWGEGMPIEHVAAAAGTISYELMCAITARVPMSY